MLNYESHYEHFLKLAKEGAEDVVHFTISSGLSPTKTVAAKAAAEVRKEYPKFEVYVVDPLTATVGQGALVRIALQDRNAGQDGERAYEHVNSLREHIQHFIVADDLNYLKRGGRLSARCGGGGGACSPSSPSSRSIRKASSSCSTKCAAPRRPFSYIKAKIEKERPDPDYQYVFIVHTDNSPCADELAQYVREKLGIEPYVSIMGPVIGSHVGPNAFALGYISKSERNEF